MTTFVRDRFTWLAYGMLAYFAYLQAALGPAIPFLRQELNLSYTVAGFHATALALGMILAGLSADQAARADNYADRPPVGCSTGTGTDWIRAYQNPFLPYVMVRETCKDS